jgi:hypothetical protein
MSTLWVFGDSYSDNFIESGWSKQYVQHKGYLPKTFGQIISENMNMTMNNHSYSGSDNDTIYETICQHAPSIQKGDIIIIGWSSVLRFRLPSNPNKWIVITPNTNNNLFDNFNLTKEVIEEILYQRSLPNYIDEYQKRRNFLSWLFRDNIIIHWTPFRSQLKFIYGFSNINTIREETNMVVDDVHYSELGHQQMSVHLTELINNQEKRDFYNNISIKLL